MKLNIQDTFNKLLPADPNKNNFPRQVLESCFSLVDPKNPGKPTLVHFSDEMLLEIGLEKEDGYTEEFTNVFSGAKVIDNTSPYAMCYGGHQFGGWAGQLGDGRAINLAEVVHNNNRWALQLKGAGETPYSRTADGLAVLRSSVREYLCSEAMHHLGVPTTRALSLMLSGDRVLRDVLYDGNPAYEKGAIVCRASTSFIRFGNFQIFAARGDTNTLRQLTDYTIKHFFPNINPGTKEGYLQFFQAVVDRTLEMIIHWQRVGFVHGVMNTDNMSILGLTIDYGPYGWLEGYDHNWTPNTTDAQGKRYRYSNQPNAALWNLVQLANALYLLIEEPTQLEEILSKYQSDFRTAHLDMMRQKLGLQLKNDTDTELIRELEHVLQLTETDMTIFYRSLSNITKERDKTGSKNSLDTVIDSFYKPTELAAEIREEWMLWFDKYHLRLKQEKQNDKRRKEQMNRVNPKYVLRNYMAQMAIDKADNGDYSLIDELYRLIKQPYSEQPNNVKWFAKRPEWARHKVGCSMLSCSS